MFLLDYVDYDLILSLCREYFVLPTLTEEGYRVTILRLKETALERFSLTAITRRILMVLDIRLQEEASLTNIMIFDLKVMMLIITYYIGHIFKKA
jgi:hypothetical protein